MLTVLFLAIIGGVGAFQMIIELARGDDLQALEVFHQKPSSANLRAYEQRLEERSIMARRLRPWFQLAQLGWLRDAGDKALLGRHGWFFYKPGYNDLVARSASVSARTDDPVRAICDFRDQLQGRGIKLLLVPAPNKESIYPDMLTRRSAGKDPVLSPVTRDLLKRLRAADVLCVDLFSLFKERRLSFPDAGPLYLAQDSHWSPAGVELAAKATAETLTGAGWVQPGRTKYAKGPVSLERVGDVVRMLQSPGTERRLGPEKVHASRVMTAADNQPCLEDPNSEILILGDSFLRIYQQDEPGSAGFIAHVAKELKQPVTSLVNDGGASTLVRQELFRHPALLRNKKVVIWEFVERDIRLGTEGWKQVPLPPPDM